MKKKLDINKWAKYFKNRGLSDDVIAEYLPYIEKLQINKVPIIFEFEHLSKLFGIKWEILATMINCPESYNRKFSIPKRRGGTREIVSPYPSLLLCQNWIYKNILLSQPVHNCAHGFVPGRSIISNSIQHLAKKTLLKMDLKNFFPSISINWVINYFSSLGYAKNVAFYLSALCCYEDHLSQGASTSPYLTNILLQNLDKRLDNLSKKYQLTYTRYADDLTFSGAYIPYKYIDIVSQIVCNYGLKVNTDKTRLHTKPGQRIVTGLSVAGDTLKIPKTTKRQLRQEVHYIRKYGYLSHISNNKITQPYYLETLLGKLNFWSYVESDNVFVKGAINYLNEIRNLQ